LYFRSFNKSSGDFAFEKSADVKEKASVPIWKGMNWQFTVSEFLPRAIAKERFVPVNLRPGLEGVPGVVPALRCQLTTDKGKDRFWLAQRDSGSTTVTIGGETYQIGYNTHAINVGFDVKLLRAEHTRDPGTTSNSATYSSYVQV